MKPTILLLVISALLSCFSIDIDPAFLNDNPNRNLFCVKETSTNVVIRITCRTKRFNRDSWETPIFRDIEVSTNGTIVRVSQEYVEKSTKDRVIRHINR